MRGFAWLALAVLLFLAWGISYMVFRIYLWQVVEKLR
jgi:hypothetical protein